MKIVFELFGGFGNSFGAGDFGFLISSRGVVFGSFDGSRKDSSERSRVRAQAGRFNEALVALDGFGCVVERICPMMKRIMNKPTAPAPILKILDLITVESFDDFSGRLLAAI